MASRIDCRRWPRQFVAARIHRGEHPKDDRDEQEHEEEAFHPTVRSRPPTDRREQAARCSCGSRPPFERCRRPTSTATADGIGAPTIAWSQKGDTSSTIKAFPFVARWSPQ